MSGQGGYWDRFLLWCPGALGLLLRQRYLPRRFGSCGKGVLFGRNLSLSAPQRIHLGDRVILNNNAVLDAANGRPEGRITLARDVFIGAASMLAIGHEGSITIESGANLSSACKITADYGNLVIGSDCLVAAYCTLGGGRGGGETAAQKQPANQQTATCDTFIGQGCWLGVRASVSEGIHIGRDSIIGAHAEVADSIPAYAIAVGRPARVVKDRKQMAEASATADSNQQQQGFT